MPRYKRTLIPLICVLFLFGLVYSTISSLPVQSFESDEAEFEKFQKNMKELQADSRLDHIGGSQENKGKIQESEEKSGNPMFKGPKNERQRAVADAFRHAWAGYKKYAWGHDQLKPQSRGHSDWFDTGLTIVDALDTAMIMGLEQEVKDGTEWIENSLNFDKDRYVNLFEVTIRVLGGLLTGYHFTGNKVFLTRAEDLGQRLLGGFTDSKSPVPFSDVNLKTKAGRGPSWGSESSLSEVTTLQLEFRDLSRITGNSTFEKIAFKTSEHIHEIGCGDHGGLCDMFINANTGKFKEKTTITFGARADSYYEYLLKQWIQTGKTIDWLRTDYEQAMSSMDEKMVRLSEPNKLLYIGELLPPADSFSSKMDHLVCFLAGTLGLGVQNGMPSRHMEIAEGLAEACHAMYETPTGLGPEIVYFNMLPGKKEDLSIKPLDAHCLLRPEAIEAWFYMYRFTGDKKYQDWGWSAFQSNFEKMISLSHLLGLIFLASPIYSASESIPAFSISNDDILKLADQLRALDENKASRGQVVVNFQGHTSTRDNSDNADRNFFTKVDSSLLRKPTYEQFVKLSNNFERQTGVKEPKVSTNEEKSETTQFIDLIFQTKPWKALYDYFHKKQHPFAKDPITWRYWIAQLWFVHYSRARGLADTSGFEHVFMGEAKNGEVSGLHNWLRMYLLERNSTENFNYRGFLVKRGNLMGAVKFSWQSEMKRSGSLLIGTSPEFDMALYTMCFLSRRGRQTCDVEIDGCNLQITSYDLSQQGKVFIGSIFPSAGRMTDKCRQLNQS